MTTERLGTHFLLDLAEAPFGALDDRDAVERTLLRAVEAMGARLLGSHLHRLEPQGVSGVVVISESHVTIHTWPERGEAAVDLFTCGDPVRARAAAELIARELLAGRSRLREMPRGLCYEAPAPPSASPKG